MTFRDRQRSPHTVHTSCPQLQAPWLLTIHLQPGGFLGEPRRVAGLAGIEASVGALGLYQLELPATLAVNHFRAGGQQVPILVPDDVRGWRSSGLTKELRCVALQDGHLPRLIRAPDSGRCWGQRGT